MPLYELALMGDPSGGEIASVEACLSKVIDPFGLRLGAEVAWSARAIIEPASATHGQRNACNTFAIPRDSRHARRRSNVVGSP